jgi:hypothetical protein
MKPHYEINSSPNFVVQHPMEHNYIEDENGKKGQVLGLEFEFPIRLNNVVIYVCNLNKSRLDFLPNLCLFRVPSEDSNWR